MKKLLACVLTVTVLGIGAGHIFAAPGDSNDPIITLKYIESVLLPSVEKKIQQAAAPVFEVVDIKKGEKVTFEAGAEVILRKGSASVFTTEKGGIANVTSGVDLKSGEAVPANSLMIVPLSDGRGFIANDDLILMIKGNFSKE